MWNEILGALAILGMVVFCAVVLPAAPKLVDAICDRLRYGVQEPFDDTDEPEEDETPATPAETTAKPATATAKPVASAAKPTPTRTAA